jgi:hypothetical protein
LKNGIRERSFDGCCVGDGGIDEEEALAIGLPLPS